MELPACVVRDCEEMCEKHVKNAWDLKGLYRMLTYEIFFVQKFSKSNSHLFLQKNIYFDEKPFKVMKNDFLFSLNSTVRSQNIWIFFCLDFLIL